MPDIREIAKDPDFKRLPIEEQRKAFSEYDSDFASLPIIEQDKGISELTGMPTVGAERLASAVSGKGGFIDNITADLKRRYETLKRLPAQFPGVDPRFPLRAGGEIAGGLLDPLNRLLEKSAEGYKLAYKEILPEQIRADIAGGLKTLLQPEPGKRDLVKDISALLQPQPGKRDLVKDISALIENIPPDLQAALNLSMFIPGGALAKKGIPAVTEGVNIGRDIVSLAGRKTPEVISQKINNIIKYNLGKAIKVSPQGKQTWPLVERYFDKAGVAVQDIIGNKKNLNITNVVGDVVENALPETRIQQAQAIHSTKSKIYNEYNAKQIAAGEKGAIVDLESIAAELDDVINNKTLLADVDGRAIIEHAKLQQQYLREAKNFTPQQAQEWIARANSKLNPSYAKGTFIDVSKAGVDESIASMMRQQLDSVIEGAGERGYQDLKNRYGALVELERGSNKAALAALSKAKVPNFFDITSGTALVHGILSMNPVVITTAGFMESLNVLRRYFQNPDTYVKKMFKDTEKLLEQRKTAGMPFTAKSNLFDVGEPQYRDFAPSAGRVDPNVERQGLDELRAIITGTRNPPKLLPWQDFEIVGERPRGFDLVKRDVIQQGYDEWAKRERAKIEGRIFEPYPETPKPGEPFTYGRNYVPGEQKATPELYNPGYTNKPPKNPVAENMGKGEVVQPAAMSGGKISIEETVLGKSSYGTSIYKDGKLIGEGTFTIGDDGVAKVGMIRAIGGRDTIAPMEWRDVLGQLKEKYPQITKFEGDRITRLPVVPKEPAAAGKQPWEMTREKAGRGYDYVAPDHEGKLWGDTAITIEEQSHISEIVGDVKDIISKNKAFRDYYGIKEDITGHKLFKPYLNIVRNNEPIKDYFGAGSASIGKEGGKFWWYSPEKSMAASRGIEGLPGATPPAALAHEILHTWGSTKELSDPLSELIALRFYVRHPKYVNEDFLRFHTQAALGDALRMKDPIYKTVATELRKANPEYIDNLINTRFSDIDKKKLSDFVLKDYPELVKPSWQPRKDGESFIEMNQRQNAERKAAEVGATSEGKQPFIETAIATGLEPTKQLTKTEDMFGQKGSSITAENYKKLLKSIEGK